MSGRQRSLIFAMFIVLVTAAAASAQDGLNPQGDPRYGRQQLASRFAPAPFTLDLLSGGDQDVKALNLGDNCLGYAATDPDFVVELAVPFSRVTFLVAGDADTTLIINLPNGSWSCNDDTNGLNPALVYYDAAPGSYTIWIGSYAAETYDDAVLYVSEAGPESLPTTATGPDPMRDPVYGEATLSPGFIPSPFQTQFIGGGRSQLADFTAQDECRGYVSEAPDFTLFLDEAIADLWISMHSPADMMLLVIAADGRWQCSDNADGRDARISFDYALAGFYDIWIGSSEAGNFAAGILYVTEFAPDAALHLTIDTNCPGMLDSVLQIGARAVVSQTQMNGSAIYAVPETASTTIFEAAPGTTMEIVGGPVCDEDYRWWRVALEGGGRGWTPDGDAESRWLESAG